MLIVLLKHLYPNLYYGIYKIGVVDTTELHTNELKLVNKALEVSV
jgi:glutathionyl-hydroquinone reductase